SAPKAIRTLLTMFWMNKNEDSIIDFYSKEDFENDFWLSYSQNRILNYDIDFSKINHAGRLKVKIEKED
ncbi:MAG: hypothetical protein AAFN65_04940, partial [Bacteroidota bacterium]